MPGRTKSRTLYLGTAGEHEGIIQGVVKTEHGQLVTYLIPSLGENYTAEFYESDGSGNEDGRFDLSHMPAPYKGKYLSDFRWDVYGQTYIETVKRIVEATVTRYDEYIKTGRGLYISSKTPGSGKTMLACCLANEIIKRRDLSVKFITAPRYAKMRFEDRPEYMKCSLLILDDWGTQSEKQDWVTEALFELIDYRYEERLSTFYTSNLSQRFCSKDERTKSRITSDTTPLIMPEFSVRDEIAKKRNQSFLDEILKDG